MLLVKSHKTGRYLVLNRQIFFFKFCLDFDYAFCNTEVDFAGPLYIKDIYGKNDQIFKSYICLFTCATTRNIHLELTPSMDASDIIKS